MNNRVALLAGLLVLLPLSGCQTLQSLSPAQGPSAAAEPEETGAGEASEAAAESGEPAAEAEAPEDYADLSGDMLFDILLGEIAGQRKELDVSVEHYLRAAEASRDPRVAERALRIGIFGKNDEASLAAARRWVELDPDNLEARQSLAMLALRNGIEDEALAQLEKIVIELGAGEEAFTTITGMLARDEDREAALRLIQRLAEKYPASAQAQLALSRLAEHGGETTTAFRAVQKALALEPEWPDAIIQKARLRLKNDQAAKALEELEAAVKAQPQVAKLRMTYARLLLEQNDFDAAREQFKAVIDQDPAHADALYSLGLLALESEQHRAGEKYFKRLLELGERQQEAYYYLGRIAEARDNPRQAIDWYNQINKGDYLADAQIRVAQLLARTGNLSAARRQLHALRVRNPQLAAQLYLMEGQLLVEAGKEHQAMDLYNSVLEQRPDNTDLLYSRALLAEQMDKLDMALADFRRIIEMDPDNATALNALGYTLADRTDRYREALIYIEKALALEPDKPSILDSMGWVQYRLGNLEKAEKYLRAALEKIDDGEIAAHLGEVLWEQGRRDEAREFLEAALERHPDNPVLQETVQRLLAL